MTGSTLETVLRRDRLIVAGALAAIVALAWTYVLWLANDMDMGGMDMTGFRMIPAGIGIMLPANEPWRAIEFAYVFAMWAVMMVGMMAPSAAPMILMYARVGRQGRIAGKPLAATGWFAAGYILAWTCFSLAATLVQWGLEREALLDPRMQSASSTLGAVVLVAAGIYQWTPLKDVCLAQCQTPLGFLMRHGGFRSDVPGCLALGLRHGAYCVGCCWVLMALLFVVGVMNVLWIALLALLVLLEKLTPWGRWVARAAGVACVAAGVWMVSSEPAAATPTSAFPPKSSPSYLLPRSDESLPVHGQVDWHGVDHLDAPSHQLAFGGCNICSGIIVNDVSWLPGRSMAVVIGIDAQDDDLRSIGNVAGNPRTPP
jgi:predicted metal-binding membrane protein